MQPLLLAAVLAITLTGCAAPASAPAPAPRAQMQFLDLPGFEDELGSSLAAPLPRVEVSFYDRVTPSKMPDRLQKWMAAVEAQGGKVKVTPPPSSVTARSPLMLVSAISSLWSAHKMVREQQAEARLKAAGRYDAELTLRQDDRGDVVLDKIVFTLKP